MFVGGFVSAVSMGTALFSGFVPTGELVAEFLSLALALTTAFTVASASALDA
jgi:hypothetical protein